MTYVSGPERAKRPTISDIQIAQGWTTDTTEMWSRRFLEKICMISPYADFLENKSMEKTAGFSSGSKPDQVGESDPGERILNAQIQAGWSTTDLDLLSQEFIKGKNLEEVYAGFLEAKAEIENADGGPENVPWD